MQQSNTTVRGYLNVSPQIHDSAIILDGARIIGDVTIGSGSSVWYNAVIRGDVHTVMIGSDTNIQDNSVLHVTHDRFSLTIGDRVTVGHGARIHGCVVEEETLIGIGAIVLDGAVIRRHAMVAAGAVVTPGTIVESGVLVAGVPAKPIRALTDEEIEDLPQSAERYRRYAMYHSGTEE